MTKLKAYIAGPHPFYPKYERIGFHATVEQLSEKYGFEALVPKDDQVVAESKAKLAMLIYQKNIQMIKEADLVIADITSFRGVSADAGTIYEVGYARALNKPVVMWTADSFKGKPIEYKDRCGMFMYGVDDECSVEEFGLVDNLMITRPFDLVHCSVEDAFGAAWNLFNFKGNYDETNI